MVCVSLAIATSLTIVYGYARRNNGIELLTSNHYAWTYGPTALFVVITSFWRLMDFNCKALAPWVELHKGPSTADRSMWLDHISSFLVSTVWKAIKMSHFAVVATTCGFVLLKATSLMSTGLFFVTPTQIGPTNTSMTYARRLDNVTALREYGEASFEPSSMYNLYAVLERGLPYAEGVTQDFAYEYLRPQNQSSNANSTYTVRTRAFVPETSCTAVNIQHIVHASNYGNYTHNYTLEQVPDLSINTTELSCKGDTLAGTIVPMCPVGGWLCPPRQLNPVHITTDCISLNGASPSNVSLALIALYEFKLHQVFNVSTTNYTLGDALRPVESDAYIDRTSAILCQMSHRFEEVELTYDRFGNDWPAPRITKTGKSLGALEGANTTVLVNAVFNPLNGGHNMFGTSIMGSSYGEQIPDALMRLIASRAGGDYDTLLQDTGLFVDAASSILSSLLAQAVHEVMHPVSSQIESRQEGLETIAQVFMTEDRLHVQPLSFIVMLITMLLLILMTVAVWICRPGPDLSRYLEQPLSTLAVLANSSVMSLQLDQLASRSESQARKTTSVYTYSIAGGQGATLQPAPISESHFHPGSQAGSRRLRHAHWAPFMLSVPVTTVTLASSIAVIGILELVQHYSDEKVDNLQLRHNASDLELSTITRYVPALVMLLVATLYNCLDFNTAILAPCSRMHAKATDGAVLKTPSLALLPPAGFWRAAIL